MPRDDDAEDLLSEHPDAVAATAQRLRAVLLDAHPQLEERVRRGWHSINYRDPVAGFVCALFPTADRVQLVFEHGARLPDQIDTVRDSEALSAVGLDQATLQGKLAGGAIGGSMAM